MKKSKKSFEWNKVTSLSKYLAMALSVALPFVGFVLGMQYQRKIDDIPQPIIERNTPTQKPQPSPLTEISCGNIPDSVHVETDDHFTVVTGPMWSPDCKHISWSTWQSTFLNPAIPEGLFIYDVETKITKRVYKAISGKNHQDTTVIKSWKDNDSIVFTKNDPGPLFIYDLVSNKIQQL